MRRNYIFALFCFIAGCLQAPPMEGGPNVEKYLTGGVPTDNVKFQSAMLIPTDDDQALAETVRTGFRVVSDRSKYLHNVLSQYRPRVTAFSNNGTEISITAYPVMVYDPTTDPGNPVWLQFKAVTPALLVPAGLAADTHYYVYGVNNAGNLDFSVSTTPPDAALIGKGGDVAFRYLFHFRTVAAGAISPFHFVNGRFRYMNPTVSISPGAGVSATIDISAYVPPHAQRAFIESTLSNIDPTAGIFILFRPPLLALNESIQHSGPAMAGPIANVSSQFIDQTIISQSFDVSISGATLARWGATCAGYSEH